MSLQIAKDTGANIKVIILSKNQLMTVKLRAQTEGLNEKVSFEL
jgi:cyclopropane fatty-acyl-phospholipid synthase-like methyltransferase